MHFCWPRTGYESEPRSSRFFVCGAELCYALNCRQGVRPSKLYCLNLNIYIYQWVKKYIQQLQKDGKENQTLSRFGILESKRTCSTFSFNAVIKAAAAAAWNERRACLQPAGGAAGNKSLNSQPISPLWHSCSSLSGWAQLITWSHQWSGGGEKWMAKMHISAVQLFRRASFLYQFKLVAL